MTFLFRLLIWIVAAMVICWPVSVSPKDMLIGNPEIDVWNHAWGFWYVYKQLITGNGLIHTDLVGAPAGGSLYFIDTPGALAALPITAVFGPAVAYNVVLILRVALAGLAGQMLAKELSKRNGVHNWLAGAACATTPFLLCEMNNGISEVCATQWIIFSFWAAAKAFRRNRWRDWGLLGLFLGLTATATFYYGLTAAFLLAPAMGYNVIKRMFRGHDPRKALLGAIGAGALALLMFSPQIYLFWESLGAADGLIKRETTLNDRLLMHNAVDPKIYLMPGNYQSVDLLNIFKEPFIHTGYLRWSIVLLAGIALCAYKRLRFWGCIAAVSLILGMGPYLWMNGAWVSVNGQYLSLPFDWIRSVLPEIAITHPLRLSIGAQVCMCALAGCGAAWLLDRAPQNMYRPTITILIALVVAESFWGSSAQWPLKSSEATIPDFYQKAKSGAVLDLPAEVGRTMKSSRHFWMQTAHEKPIPYTPDVRVGSARDQLTFRAFIGSDGVSESPSELSPKVVNHIRSTYGLVVLHPDLGEELSSMYLTEFEKVFGKPTQAEGKWYWEFDVREDDLTAQGSASICDTLGKRLDRLTSAADAESLSECGVKLSQYCTSWARKRNAKPLGAELCAKQFQTHPTERDFDVLLQLLQHNDETVRKSVVSTLESRPLSSEDKRRLQRYASSESNTELQIRLKKRIE